MDGAGYGAATAIAAIKSCALGAPLRGYGTLTATPRSSPWHRCRRHGILVTAEQDVSCLVPSGVMLLMGVAFARWLGRTTLPSPQPACSGAAIATHHSVPRAPHRSAG